MKLKNVINVSLNFMKNLALNIEGFKKKEDSIVLIASRITITHDKTQIFRKKGSFREIIY